MNRLIIGLVLLAGCTVTPVKIPVYMLPPCVQGTEIRETQPGSRILACFPAEKK